MSSCQYYSVCKVYLIVFFFNDWYGWWWHCCFFLLCLKKIMMIMWLIDWCFLLEPVQGISYIHFELTKIINPFFLVFLRIRVSCNFVWCSFPKMRKPNVIQIPFIYKSAMTGMDLFEHVCSTVSRYLSMCVWLKWVGSDKMLEYLSTFDGLYVWYPISVII